jgi:enoyl-CoA hydratase/carnithine racemase
MVRAERRRHADGKTAAHVLLESHDGMNRLGHATVKALRSAVDAAGTDEEVGLIVIEAVGDSFCAGGDRDEQAGMNAGSFREFLSDLVDLYYVIGTCGPPVLAKVQGNAVGGGAALALSCDLMIASAHSKFAFPEARLGLAVPGFLLARIMTPRAAAEASYAGRAYSAADLQMAGLVNKVVEGSELDTECAQWVQTILRQSVFGLRASKASLATAMLANRSSMIQHIDIQVSAFTHAATKGTPG